MGQGQTEFRRTQIGCRATKTVADIGNNNSSIDGRTTGFQAGIQRKRNKSRICAWKFAEVIEAPIFVNTDTVLLDPETRIKRRNVVVSLPKIRERR